MKAAIKEKGWVMDSVRAGPRDSDKWLQSRLDKARIAAFPSTCPKPRPPPPPPPATPASDPRTLRTTNTKTRFRPNRGEVN